jgi:hypothetical protein
MVHDGEPLGEIQLDRRPAVPGLRVVVVDEQDDVLDPFFGQDGSGGPQELAPQAPPTVLRLDLQPPDHADPGSGQSELGPSDRAAVAAELDAYLAAVAPPPERQLRARPAGRRRRQIQPPVLRGEPALQEGVVGHRPVSAGEAFEPDRQLGGGPEGEDRVAPAHTPQQWPQDRLDQLRYLPGVEPEQITLTAPAPPERPGAEQRPVGTLHPDRPHRGQLLPPPRIGRRPAGQRRPDPLGGAGGLAGQPVPVDEGTYGLDVVGPEGSGLHRRSSTTFPKVRSAATKS